MQRHVVNAAILWFVLTFVGELLVQFFLGFPPAVAREAAVIDHAFRLLMILGLPVFTFVLAVMIYSLLNFRTRDDRVENGATIYGNNAVSLTWFLITAGLCITVIIHPGLTGLYALAAQPNTNDLTVKVTGSQWSWRVAYPDYGKSSREELLLPVGRRVRFEVTSTDVLHSFWVPAFRLKIDAVPGRITTMYVTPTETGTTGTNPMLRVQCAEMCGLNHASMKLPIRIVEQAEFDAWAGVEVSRKPETGNQEAETPKEEASHVEQGKALADELGCLGCHSTDGSKIVGPTWKGLYESQVSLADGTTVTADDGYLRESIMDPNAEVVHGFPPNVMPPTFGKTLTEEQIKALLDYIESLK